MRKDGVPIIIPDRQITTIGFRYWTTSLNSWKMLSLLTTDLNLALFTYLYMMAIMMVEKTTRLPTKTIVMFYIIMMFQAFSMVMLTLGVESKIGTMLIIISGI